MTRIEKYQRKTKDVPWNIAVDIPIPNFSKMMLELVAYGYPKVQLGRALGAGNDLVYAILEGRSGVSYLQGMIIQKLHQMMLDQLNR